MWAMRIVARSLQMLGLAITLSGILLAEGGTDRGAAMSLEMGGLVLGAAVFYVGWRLQQQGSS